MEDLFDTMLRTQTIHEGRKATKVRRNESRLEENALIEALGGESIRGNRYTQQDSAWLDLDHAIAARSSRSEELDFDDFRYKGRMNEGEEESNFEESSVVDDEF